MVKTVKVDELVKVGVAVVVVMDVMMVVGAGVEIPEARALRNGDRVDIEAQGIGRLSNPVGR